MKKIFSLKNFFIVGIILLLVSSFMKGKYPDREDILPQLYKSPVQKKISMKPFKVEREGIVYKIIPHYSYELYGMVVSYFNSDTWWNIYHREWKDKINKKDICVVWGENIKQEVYKYIKFKSTSFVCTFQTRNMDAWSKFKANCLSNNHLLASEKSIQKQIMAVERGDQVYLKGYLASYERGKEFKRGTSITREDVGNGACETIFVTDFKILKKNAQIWRWLNLLSKIFLVGVMIVGIYSFFNVPKFR